MEKNMNNEPIAWMMENPQNTSAYLTFEKPTREMKISHQAIPLYTHPAKTLTDEEILKMAADKFHYSEYKLVIDFVRELEKAQEK
jgi:hypothetical protein